MDADNSDNTKYVVNIPSDHMRPTDDFAIPALENDALWKAHVPSEDDEKRYISHPLLTSRYLLSNPEIPIYCS
jgi:hypothetical protein